MGGSGKSTLCNKLQQQLGENKLAVCAPTHKASLINGAVTTAIVESTTAVLSYR